MLYRLNILEGIDEAFKYKNLSRRTEIAYTDWIYRFVAFNQQKHPVYLGEKEIAQFLTFLAIDKNISASSQKQALNAIGFLYRNILKIPLKKIDYKHVKAEKKKLIILSRDEVERILSTLSGEKKLMVSLLYGSGLRLMECLKLRIKDIDFGNNTLSVFDFGGKIDRITLLPQSIKKQLFRQTEKAKIKFEENMLVENFSGASISAKIESNTLEIALNPGWQYIFPSVRLVADPITGKLKQHHRHESFLQKTVKEAAQKSQISCNISCNTFRHSFAVHLLEDGYDIHTVQKLMGHKEIRTTLKYNHVLKRNRLNVHSPLDFY